LKFACISVLTAAKNDHNRTSVELKLVRDVKTGAMAPNHNRTSVELKSFFTNQQF